MKLVLRIAVVVVISMVLNVTLFAQPSDSDYVIVTNKAFPGDAISINTLKVVYQREATNWKHNEADVIPVDLYTSDAFYSNMLGKSYVDMQMQWLKMRNNRSLNMPIAAKDAASVKKIVAANRDAIGFVKANDVDSSVKVIKLVN
jgi:hypothetical protein